MLFEFLLLYLTLAAGWNLKCFSAAALKLNTGLRELYLADNDLGATDAVQLGGLLRSNFTLQLLDIRSVQHLLSLSVLSLLEVC
jgi:hypothetical protein